MSYGLGRKEKRCEGRQFLKRPPWTMWNVLINRSINTHLQRKRRDTCKCGRWEITWYNRHWNSAVSVCVVGITCFPGRTLIDARTLFTILPATTACSHKAATRPFSCLAHSHSSGLKCRDAAHCPKYFLWSHLSSFAHCRDACAHATGGSLSARAGNPARLSENILSVCQRCEPASSSAS